MSAVIVVVVVAAAVVVAAVAVAVAGKYRQRCGVDVSGPWCVSVRMDA